MKILIALLMVFSVPAWGRLDTQRRCYVDTMKTANATGAGASFAIASANRSCLVISNKSTSLKVYYTTIASTTVGDGIEIGANSTFQPTIVPTNAVILHTTGDAAAVTVFSGYYIE